MPLLRFDANDESQFLILSHETDKRIAPGEWIKLKKRLNFEEYAEIKAQTAMRIAAPANIIGQQPTAENVEKTEMYVDTAGLKMRRLAAFIFAWSYAGVKPSIRTVGHLDTITAEVCLEWIAKLMAEHEVVTDSSPLDNELENMLGGRLDTGNIAGESFSSLDTITT